MIDAPVIDAPVVEEDTDSLQVPTTAAALLSGRTRRVWKHLVPPLISLLLLAPSICWVLQDRTVWPWDQAWYGEVTVELYYTLRHNPAGWLAAMAHSIPSKPPGLTWLGQFFVPLGKRIGSVDHALLLVNVLLQFITLMLIYRIGKALSPKQGRTVAVVGCALVAAAPLFVGMSHQYLIEPLQTLAVTWFYYCAIMSPRWGRLCILSHLVAATAVALLAKTTSPLYCLLPGLMGTVQLFRRRPTEDRAGPLTRAVQVCGLLLGLGLLAGAVVWYRVNWEAVRRHAYLSSFGDVALDYGHKDVFLNKLALWFRALQEGPFTPPLFWMGTFLVLVGLAVWWSRPREVELSRQSWASWLALFAGLHLAAVLATFSFTITEETRFLTPILPAVAVLVMWAVAQLPVRAAGVVFVAVLMVQWGYVHAITLDLIHWQGHPWLVRIDRDPTRADEVTRAVQLTCGQANRYNIVGIELPWCNANSFEYYAAKNKLVRGQHSYYTGLGYAQKDLDKALARIDEVNTAYFISVEEEHQPKPANFVNQVSAPVLAKVREDDRFERLPFVSDLGVVVFQRKSR